MQLYRIWLRWVQGSEDHLDKVAMGYLWDEDGKKYISSRIVEPGELMKLDSLESICKMSNYIVTMDKHVNFDTTVLINPDCKPTVFQGKSELGVTSFDVLTLLGEMGAILYIPEDRQDGDLGGIGNSTNFFGSNDEVNESTKSEYKVRLNSVRAPKQGNVIFVRYLKNRKPDIYNLGGFETGSFIWNLLDVELTKDKYDELRKNPIWSEDAVLNEKKVGDKVLVKVDLNMYSQLPTSTQYEEDILPMIGVTAMDYERAMVIKEAIMRSNYILARNSGEKCVNLEEAVEYVEAPLYSTNKILMFQYSSHRTQQVTVSSLEAMDESAFKRYCSDLDKEFESSHKNHFDNVYFRTLKEYLSKGEQVSLAKYINAFKFEVELFKHRFYIQKMDLLPSGFTKKLIIGRMSLTQM